MSYRSLVSELSALILSKLSPNISSSAPSLCRSCGHRDLSTFTTVLHTLKSTGKIEQNPQGKWRLPSIAPTPTRRAPAVPARGPSAPTVPNPGPSAVSTPSPSAPAASTSRPDSVAKAQDVINMMNELLTTNGLTQQGWTSTLHRAMRIYSRISWNKKTISISTFLVPKVDKDVLVDIALMLVAKTLMGLGADKELYTKRAIEMGYKGLALPASIVSKEDRRWKVTCRACTKTLFVNVASISVRRATCCGQRMKIRRNPAHGRDVVVVSPHRRQKKMYQEGEDGYQSGCPPECYDKDGAFIGN